MAGFTDGEGECRRGGGPCPRALLHRRCHPAILQGPSSSWGLLPTKRALKSEGAIKQYQGGPKGNSRREQDSRKRALCPHQGPEGQQGTREAPALSSGPSAKVGPRGMVLAPGGSAGSPSAHGWVPKEMPVLSLLTPKPSLY